MSDGRILAESGDSLPMAPLSCPKYASRSIDRSTAVIVSAPAGLSPVGGGYARLPRQGAGGGICVYQQRAIGVPHVVQVGGTVAIGHYRPNGVLRAQPGEAAPVFGPSPNRG